MSCEPPSASVALEHFASFAEFQPEATLLLDGNGKVLAANRACEALLGCAAASLLGVPLARLTRDGDDVVAALIRAGSRSRQPLPGALVFESTAAASIETRCDIGLLRPRDGEQAAQLCLRLVDRNQHADRFLLLSQRVDELSREINRRRNAEEKLQLQSQQLIEEARRKDEFLAMLAHELRNPLTPIALGVDLLQGIESKHPKVDHIATMMKRQIRHIKRLIDDLLDVARLTHGKMELQRRPELLGEILARAVELVRPLVDERGLRLMIGDIPALNLDADIDRLVQVFGNLLGNAVKFCRPGGEIMLTVEPAGDEVMVSVCDNGVGIDAAFLPQIFEAFVQDDRSLDRTSGGLGVGLSIVRSIVGLHGGRVAARSAGRGCGTEMLVHLPLIGPPAAADELAAAGSRSVEQTSGCEPRLKLRVLVVEDNADSAEAMRELLGDWGHEALDVASGHAALERWDRWRPDVALLDIGLPGMSGLQLARRLRELAADRPLLLIAISGYDSAADRQASSESGFDLHLPKPVDLDWLEMLLSSHAASLGPAANP